MQDQILVVNYGVDSFQRAALGELGKHFAVRLWPYNVPKEHCLGRLCSFTPLLQIHLEAVKRIPEGPNLRAPIWPDGLCSEESRMVELSCDRVFPAAQSRGDHISYLSRLAERIDEEVEGLAASCVLFPDTPHFPWDLLVALKLANRGVPVFALRPTQIANRIIVSRVPFDFLAGSFERRPDNLSIPAIDVKEVHVDSSRLKIAKSLNRHSSPTPGHFFIVQTTRFARSLFSSKRKDLWDIFKINSLRPDHQSAETRAQHEDHYWDFLSGRDFVRLRVKSLSHMYSMMREMSHWRSAGKGDYVYFALHYQPERNTDPESSFYRFQSAAVAQFRRLLDEQGLRHLKIVVKDHPRQFGGGGDFRPKNFRVRGFYEAIAKIDNTFVADLRADSASLIHGAVLVVTLNGSAAWEAARIGKPSLTLAMTWHSDCVSAPSLSRLLAQGRSIRELIDMAPNEVNASVSAFLDAEQITIPGVIMGRHADSEREQDLAQEMAACLVPMIQRVVSKSHESLRSSD